MPPSPNLRIIGVSLATAVILNARVWAAPTVRVIGRVEGEFRDHVWIAWLVRTRILEGHSLPLWFPEVRFPLGAHLYPLDPLNQLVLTTLAGVIGLLPAFVVLTTALSALTGYAGARLAAALGAGPIPALCAGILTQLGPPILGSFADTQTEGMGLGWGLLLIAALADPAPWTSRRALTAGAFASALVLSAPYQAHGLAPLVIGLGAHALWTRRLPVHHALLSACLALPAAALASAGLYAAESAPGGQLVARDHASDWPPKTTSSSVIPSVTLQISPTSPVAVGAWPRESRFFPPSTGPRRYSGLLLPLFAAYSALRDRTARRLSIPLLAYAGLALGSARDWDAWTIVGGARIPLPFDLWYRYVPLAHLVWKPAQYAVPAWAIACAVCSRLPIRTSIVATAFVLLELQLLGPTPLPLPAVELHPLSVYSALAAEDTTPTGATPTGPPSTGSVADRPGVIEFPCRARSRGGRDALPYDELTAQMFHLHPIGDTFGRGENPAHQALLDALAASLGWSVGRAPPLEDAFRSAQKAGFGWLIVHGALLTPEERAGLERSLTPLAGAPTAFEGEVEQWRLPPLLLPAGPDHDPPPLFEDAG